MKVPILEAPRVGQASAPGYEPMRGGVDASPITQGLRSLAGGLGNVLSVANEADQQAQREKAQALALAEADKMLQLQERAARRLQGDSSSTGRIDDAFDGIDTSKGGFLATKGLKASEQSADVIDGLVQDAKDIAATISDPVAKQRFLLRSRESLLAYRKQVETHTARELEVAKTETVKGLAAQAISMAASGVSDFDTWMVTTRNADAAIEENAANPEAAKAQKLAFHAENSFAFVQSLVAQGREEDAADFVKEQRHVLGVRFDDASKLVAGGMAKLQARRDVSAAFDGASNEDGFVDEAKVVGAWEKLDEEKRANSGPLLKRELTLAAQRKTATVKQWKTSASGQLNAGSYASIEPALIEKLNKYEPDYLRRLKTEDELRQKRARAKARGAHDGKGQRNTDKLWVTRFKALGTSGMAEADIEDFVMGHGVSEQGVADIQVLKTRAGESVGKTENRGRDTMQDDGEKALRGLPRKRGEKTPMGLTEDDVSAFRASVFDAWDAFVAEKKRPPNAEERAKLLGELLQKATIEAPRTIFGFQVGTTTKDVRGFQVPKQADALAPKDQQALDWANANPNDPRSAAIKKRLKR